MGCEVGTSCLCARSLTLPLRYEESRKLFGFVIAKGEALKQSPQGINHLMAHCS